jgi:hypothetical protein
MTKQELKELISEAVKEQLTTESTVVTEDVVVTEAEASYDQAVAVYEACVEVLDEASKSTAQNMKAYEAKIAKFFDNAFEDALDDGLTENQAMKAAEKATNEKFGEVFVNKLAKNEAGGKEGIFKNIAGKIRSTDPKKVGIAVAATAALTAGVAAGVALVKKKKKAKEEKK